MPGIIYFKETQAMQYSFVHLDPKGRFSKGYRSSNRVYNLKFDVSVNCNISGRYLGVKRLHLIYSWCQPPLKFTYSIYPPALSLLPRQKKMMCPPPSPIFLEQKSLFLDLLILSI